MEKELKRIEKGPKSTKGVHLGAFVTVTVHCYIYHSFMTMYMYLVKIHVKSVHFVIFFYRL